MRKGPHTTSEEQEKERKKDRKLSGVAKQFWVKSYESVMAEVKNPSAANTKVEREREKERERERERERKERQRKTKKELMQTTIEREKERT